MTIQCQFYFRPARDCRVKGSVRTVACRPPRGVAFFSDRRKPSMDGRPCHHFVSWLQEREQRGLEQDRLPAVSVIRLPRPLRNSKTQSTLLDERRFQTGIEAGFCLKRRLSNSTFRGNTSPPRHCESSHRQAVRWQQEPRRGHRLNPSRSLRSKLSIFCVYPSRATHACCAQKCPLPVQSSDHHSEIESGETGGPPVSIPGNERR